MESLFLTQTPQQGPFSLEILPWHLFKEFWPNRFGQDFLVTKGIPDVLSPVWICPVMIRSKQKSIGFHSDPDGTNFYLFREPLPHKHPNRRTALVDIRCGKTEGFGPNQRHINTPVFTQLEKEVCPKNDVCAVAEIWTAYSKLLRTGNYILDREIPHEKKLLLHRLKAEDFKVVIDPYSKKLLV